MYAFHKFIHKIHKEKNHCLLIFFFIKTLFTLYYGLKKVLQPKYCTFEIMWTCPECKRKFRSTNQSHSCRLADPDMHFRNKPDTLRATYEKLLSVTREFGPYDINVVQSAIFLKTKSTYVEVKTRKTHLIIMFFLGREVTEFPMSRAVRMSKNKVAHELHVQQPDDIDEQVIRWLKESYELVK